jgi:hypothetical protein
LENDLVDVSAGYGHVFGGKMDGAHRLGVIDDGKALGDEAKVIESSNQTSRP